MRRLVLHHALHPPPQAHVASEPLQRVSVRAVEEATPPRALARKRARRRVCQLVGPHHHQPPRHAARRQHPGGRLGGQEQGGRHAPARTRGDRPARAPLIQDVVLGHEHHRRPRAGCGGAPGSHGGGAQGVGQHVVCGGAGKGAHAHDVCVRVVVVARGGRGGGRVEALRLVAHQHPVCCACVGGGVRVGFWGLDRTLSTTNHRNFAETSSAFVRAARTAKLLVKRQNSCPFASAVAAPPLFKKKTDSHVAVCRCKPVNLDRGQALARHVQRARADRCAKQGSRARRMRARHKRAVRVRVLTARCRVTRLRRRKQAARLFASAEPRDATTRISVSAQMPPSWGPVPRPRARPNVTVRGESLVCADKQDMGGAWLVWVSTVRVAGRAREKGWEKA